jgi:hypothetical protein
MISETRTTDNVNDIQCPAIDGQAAREMAADRVPGAGRAPETETALIEFDLFAEARRIYIRARGGQRVRSSNII